MSLMNKGRSLSHRIITDLSIGPSYAWLNLRRRLYQSRRSIADPIVASLNQQRVRRLIKWGMKEFAEPLARWTDKEETAIAYGNRPPTIWMAWLHGAYQVPGKYHPFIESVRRCNPSAEIRILDEKSIRSLIDIPAVISERYGRGDISPVLFTDYVRFALLEQYGGIWMDMTLFQVHAPVFDILDYPMWCIKGLTPFVYASAIPDALQWQSYYLAAQPHALCCKVVLDLFESYFDHHCVAFDYFFVYYLAYFARTIPAVQHSYNLIPPNNSRCEEMMTLVDSDKTLTPATTVSALVSEDTWMYKGSSHLNEDQTARCEQILSVLEHASASINSPIQ